MANKEVYRLDIKVGVSGDSESKSKLTAVEKMTQQIQKKTKALSKITANATAKLKDEASSKIEKLDSKVNKLKSTSMTLTAKMKDEASATVEKIQSKTKKVKEANVVVKAKDEASKVITGIENKINGWIKTGAKKVISIGTAGVIAAGGIGLGTSIKTYSEYEKGLSNVKAVTNATDSQMKQLDAAAKKFGSTTAWSARHVTEAEELLGQAGFSVNETISALPGLLNLASAGDLDLASATDIASGTLKAFNISASESGHVADVLALSASATNSDVSDLGDSLKYVAPVSQALGISLEDTAAAVGLLSNSNIKGSQSGTVLRQTMARLASPTTEASKLMQKYGINAFDSAGNMKPLSGVVDNLNSSLGKLTSQKRADVISTIFGTESMSGVLALMNQGGKSVSELSQQLKDANGAAQKMSDTKLDNLQGQWIKLKAAVEHMQITLGEKLAPYAKQFVTWLTGKMPALTDKIVEMVDYVSKHTEEIKSLAEIVIGLGAAFTALSVAGKIGNTISGISSLVGIVKGAKTSTEIAEVAGEISKLGIVGRLLPAIFTPAGLAIAASVALIGTAVVAENDLMKKSVTTTTEELGPMEKVMNALNGHINKSKKEMIDAGLIYDDFGEGISDSFKKGAQDASKSLLGIEMDVKRLTLDDEFTEGDNNRFKNLVNNYAYDAVNAIKQKQSDITSEFQKTFSLDGTVSDAEKGVMSYLGGYFEEGVNKELKIRDEIYKIGDKAIQDHGEILDADMEKVKLKLAELQSVKLEYANAENAGEQAYAKSKFASKAERVTGIDSAAELIKERAKEHQDSIDETKAKYDKTIATAQYHLNNDKNLSDTDKTNFQKAIDENKAARDEALKQAEDAWKSDLETLYNAYPKARGMINEDTGSKFNGGEIESQNKMDKIINSHSGLADITKSGVYALKNDTTKNLETLYVSVDETTGKIKGVLNGANGDIGAYSDEQKEKLLSLQNEYSNTGSVVQQLANDHAMLNTNTDQVINSAGALIGELQNIQTAEDGTVTGILDLNGTPVQITSNADGVITRLDQVTSSVNSIPNSKTITIDTVISGVATNLGQGLGSGAVNSVVNAASEVIKNIPQHYNGTDNAESGINSVGERGMELVLGRRFYNFKGGEKVLNNTQTVNLLKAGNKQDNEPFQVKQGQYKLAQPQQVQVVGGNGNSIQVDVQVNGGNQDVEKLIVEVTYEVGRKLKEAFKNIKK
nr:phage tail tape measure protein [Clostridium sp. YIM B02500]